MLLITFFFFTREHCKDIFQQFPTVINENMVDARASLAIVTLVSGRDFG
jgi:hypothetical protein